MSLLLIHISAIVLLAKVLRTPNLSRNWWPCPWMPESNLVPIMHANITRDTVLHLGKIKYYIDTQADEKGEYQRDTITHFPFDTRWRFARNFNANHLNRAFIFTGTILFIVACVFCTHILFDIFAFFRFE